MGNGAEVIDPAEVKREPPPRYHGYIAGVFSGIAKLSVGHPFDTIKVRLQTSEGRFKGPLDAVYKTFVKEGIYGFYKGATPPLIGWMVMDSVMLGSLHNYRRLLMDNVYTSEKELPLIGHCIAGAMAGWTVSFVAAPVENIKARLQVQYDAKTKLYSGPLNCAHILIKQRGLRGFYKGLFATMLFRTNFIAWWGSYELITQYFKKNTKMSDPAINFWAGGLSATVFWTVAYPSDVVKQQIMTDDVVNPKYKTWWQACKTVYIKKGWRGYFRGFVPSILRSFPANAAALAAFEAVMRALNQ